MDGLDIRVAPDHDNASALLALARGHGLTAYDAAYLDMALRTGLPLATLDGRLAAAAKAAGVVLVGA